jgi:large subunit ribosomal protein L16
MQALDRGKITTNQIESCRVAINRHFARKGQVWIRVFPHKPVTAKPLETRMGKGKGNVDHYVAEIKPGRVLFEVAGVSREDAQTALRLASAKLPIKTRFVERLERV